MKNKKLQYKIDDPADLIECIKDLDASVSDRYDVYEVAPGNHQYMYIIDVTKEFPDNTVWHNQFHGLNFLAILQEALNSLVHEIQYWCDCNPGY